MVCDFWRQWLGGSFVQITWFNYIILATSDNTYLPFTYRAGSGWSSGKQMYFVHRTEW
jgi:hypothetical protein